VGVRRITADDDVAVLGAGTMGAGIAEVAARAGHRVRLFDARPAAAHEAVEALRRRVERDVTRGRLDSEQAAELVGRVQVAAALEDLAGCALVVEAVL
jgi:3-hydroxybutyryl-CoA dehydrogenase